MDITIDYRLLKSLMIRYCKRTKLSWAASYVKCTGSLVSMHLNGKRLPSLVQIERYCRMLSITVEDITVGTLRHKLKSMEEERAGYLERFRPSSNVKNITLLRYRSRNGAIERAIV